MTDERLVDTLYDALSAEFETTHTVPPKGGGQPFTYISGEQAVSRLNEALGVLSWSFRVVEHGYNQEADEIWVLGELVATRGGETAIRQQFGSQEVKHKRDGEILEIGFDLKGAATDALKKCASLLGVGLYLSKRDELVVQPARSAPAGTNGSAPLSSPAGSIGHVGLTCSRCQEELKEITFKDGTHWTPELLAGYGRRKHSRVLCIRCYREANIALKQREEEVRPPSAPPPDEELF